MTSLNASSVDFSTPVVGHEGYDGVAPPAQLSDLPAAGGAAAAAPPKLHYNNHQQQQQKISVHSIFADAVIQPDTAISSSSPINNNKQKDLISSKSIHTSTPATKDSSKRGRVLRKEGSRRFHHNKKSSSAAVNKDNLNSKKNPSDHSSSRSSASSGGGRRGDNPKDKAAANSNTNKSSSSSKMDDSSGNAKSLKSLNRRRRSDREDNNEIDGSSQAGHSRRRGDHHDDGASHQDGSERRRHRRKDGLGVRRKSTRNLGLDSSNTDNNHRHSRMKRTESGRDLNGSGHSLNSGDGTKNIRERGGERERGHRTKRGSKASSRIRPVNDEEHHHEHEEMEGSGRSLERSGTGEASLGTGDEMEGSGASNRIRRAGTRSRKESGTGRRLRATVEESEGRRTSKVKRHSDSSRRSGADPRKRDSEKRRQLKDGSATRRSNRDPEARRRERKRGTQRLKEKDTYIPPPPSKGGDGVEGGSDGEDHHEEEGGRRGPSDVAPPAEHRVSRPRRASLNAPRDRVSRQEDEQPALETTWQRGPARRRRPSVQINSSASPATNTRRPGRVQRGAGVRQSQIHNMVLLHESFGDDPDELEQVQEEEEEDDEKDIAVIEGEEQLDLDSSNPELKGSHKRSFKPALKVAAKASTAVAKSGTKATVAVGKAGAKAMKGILGFGHKKKGAHKHDLDSSTTGLIIEEEEEVGEGEAHWSMADDHPDVQVVRTADTLYTD